MYLCTQKINDLCNHLTKRRENYCFFPFLILFHWLAWRLFFFVLFEFFCSSFVCLIMIMFLLTRSFMKRKNIIIYGKWFCQFAVCQKLRMMRPKINPFIRTAEVTHDFQKFSLEKTMQVRRTVITMMSPTTTRINCKKFLSLSPSLIQLSVKQFLKISKIMFEAHKM